MNTAGEGAREAGPLSRALSWPLELLVLAYQRLLSPLWPQSCRYYPSCSTYAVTALRRFGPVPGLWLAGRRLLSCHPWCDGGVDHVPPRGADGRPDWAAQRAEAAAREARLTAVRDDGDPTRDELHARRGMH